MTWTDPRADGPPEPRRHRRTTQTRLRWAAGIGAALLTIGAAAVVLLQPDSSPTPTSRPTGGPTPATATNPSLHMEGGVLVGFPRTSAGARSAAVNIDAALGSELMLGASRNAVLDAVADPTARPALQAQADAAYADGRSAFGLDTNGKSTQDGQTFVARRFPVGAHVVGWTPDNAVVQVWDDELTGIAGAGSTLPVRQGWATDTVALRWTGDQWRYASDAGVSGPVPVATQSPSNSADLTATVETFGGLTYG